MIAKNVTKGELEKALKLVNRAYKGNLMWNRIPEGLSRIRFTLRVKNSRKLGARIGHSGRRLISACWHAHGDFFDALFEVNPNALIISRSSIITKNKGNWIDFEIGSMMEPLLISQACNCK